MNNSFDGSALFRALPSSLLPILKYLEASKYTLVLVGGATRDFILSGSLSKDLDFEIRHQEHCVGKEWESQLNSEMDQIEHKFDLSIERLPYAVFRFTLGEYEVELSSPRIESFTEGSVGHSNFVTLLQSDLDFSAAYVRRDFTVNALGAQLDGVSKSIVLQDPLGGIDALKRKLLIPCGEDFYLDPVRFLRAVRFILKLNFSFDKELQSKLSAFELSELSDYYLRSEASKVGVLIFFKELFHTADSAEITLPHNVESLRFLAAIECDRNFNSINGLSSFLISKLDAQSIARLRDLFGLKEKFVSSLVEVFNLLQEVEWKWIKSCCELDDISDSRFTSFFQLFKLLTRGTQFDLCFLADDHAAIVDDIVKLNQLDISVELPDSLPKENTGRYILFKKMEVLWRL